MLRSQILQRFLIILFLLAHFGFRRPSTDQYNSNLILNPFIVAAISTGKCHVNLYDGRGQGKGGDAMNSMRIAYHLNKIQQPNPPSIAINIKELCAGQNKSNMVMKFNCFFPFFSNLLLQKSGWHFSKVRPQSHE